MNRAPAQQNRGPAQKKYKKGSDNEAQPRTWVNKCPPQLRCQPCRLDCWRQEWLDSHLAGKRHRMVVDEGWAVEDLPPKFFKHCHDCNWAGYSVEGWSTHVKSEDHKLRVASRPQPDQLSLGPPLLDENHQPIADTYYKYYDFDQYDQ